MCAQSPTVLRVGYTKTVTLGGAAAVIKGEGYDRELGLDLELRTFAGGPPPLLQAFVTGQLDVMTNTMVSVLLLPERGVPVRVIAATCRDAVFFMARPPLVNWQKTDGPFPAIQKFYRQYGRKVKIATNPKGSTSELCVRAWLQRFPDASRYVEVVNTGSQDQFIQLIMSGEADICSVFEHLYTLAKRADPSVDVFVDTIQLRPMQPGGAVVVREEFARQNPEIMRKLIAMNIRAVEFMRQNPDKAAAHLVKYFGDNMISAEVYAAAIRNSVNCTTADPHHLVETSRVTRDFMLSMGYIRKSVPVESMIDLKTYDEVAQTLNKKKK